MTRATLALALALASCRPPVDEIVPIPPPSAAPAPSGSARAVSTAPSATPRAP